MDGARILVVGASAGIGRAVGEAAVREGAKVAFAARRIDRLEQVVAEAGKGAIAFELDVRDDASVADGVARAVDALGGLDAVVHAAGIAHVSPLVDLTGDQWREVLETNLVGAALVARAAIAHLEATNGVFFACSSTTAERQRWGLNSYGVTKAALDRLIDGLRSEHPEMRFVLATLGSTLGTEFGDGLDADTLNEAMNRWVPAAQHDASYMSVRSLAAAIVSLLGTLHAHPDVDISHITIQPPGGPLTLPPSPEMLDHLFAAMKTRDDPRQ